MFSLLLLIVGFCGLNAPAHSAPELPNLTWQERSDWINVKTDVSPGAQGNDINDDTAAIQAAINALDYNTRSVVYFPPGTYRISSTLLLSGKNGIALIGHGRGTILKWVGSTGGVMMQIHDGGKNRYIGLTWQAGEVNAASVAIDHRTDAAESQIRHQHEAFIGFKDNGAVKGYGIRTGGGATYTSETVIENCLFVRCGTGLAQLKWNDYNFVVTGCEFQDCGVALNPERGNVHARNCRFERSTIADIQWQESQARSFRRCVSVGSKCFISNSEGTGSSPLDVQDCYISSWTSTEGAMLLRKTGPSLIFDCTFANRLTGTGPGLKLANGSYYTQQAILSKITGPIDLGPNYSVQTINQGTLGPSITSDRFRFLKSNIAVPGQVFDAKAFGATGTNDFNDDDTVAIQNTINAAKNAGGGAIAYIPTGQYNITSSLLVQGGNYTIGGAGSRTKLRWTGAANSKVLDIREPQNITLENLNIEILDVVSTNEVLHTSTGSSSMTYDGVWGRQALSSTPQNDTRLDSGGFRFENLAQGSVVRLKWLSSTSHFRNTASATILADYLEGARCTISGLSPKTGFLGLMTYHTGDTKILDNQDLIASDMYMEQEDFAFRAVGSSDTTVAPGRITISGSRGHTWTRNNIQIENYKGRIFYANQTDCSPRDANDTSINGYEFTHTGTNALDLTFARCLFTKYEPVYTMGPSVSRHMIENRLTSATQNAPIPNSNISTQAVADALDDLRGLGAKDLSTNYPNANQDTNPQPSATGNGLTGQYYDNVDFTGYKKTRVDATVDFDWGTTTPTGANLTSGDTFTTRWSGWVEPIETGTYTFAVRSDDGFRLWVNNVDGAPLVQQWSAQVPTDVSATIALTGGQKYRIKLEYFEEAGGAVAQLKWKRPGQTTATIIPQSALYAAPVSTVYYKLAARHSGHALSVNAANALAEGANVQQNSYATQPYQQWLITPQAGGYYTLNSRHSGKRLDVSSGSPNNGVNIQQWTPNTSDAQLWFIEPTGAGYYRLLSKVSNRGLTVATDSTADGANVYQWDFGDRDAQKWTLDIVEITPPGVNIIAPVPPGSAASS